MDTDERFTCERFRCNMRKEICVKRQTDWVHSGTSFSYKSAQCVGCAQGAEIMIEKQLQEVMNSERRQVMDEKKEIEKVCKKCGESKPLSKFSIARANADGHKGSCKACDAKKSKEYWAAIKKKPAPQSVADATLNVASALQEAPAATKAEKLAGDHWQYIASLLECHQVTDWKLEAIKFHYTTAFVHGYKHGTEDAL